MIRLHLNRLHALLAGLLFVCVGLLGGCDSAPAAEPCEIGTPGCPCLSDGRCFDDGEQEMRCVEGRCAAADCVPGTLGCPCLGNGTCGLHRGEALGCWDDRCGLPAEAAPGALGGRCSRSVPCEGPDLVCENNRCGLAGCDTGALGCPCGELGTCAPANGRETRCREGRCVYRDCAPGALGCPCDGDVCLEGGLCEGGVCRSDAVRRLFVAQRSVRACDVDFDRVADDLTIQFLGPVVGRAQRVGERVATGFFAREDARLGEALVELRFPASREEGMQRIRVREVTCYDGAGAPVPDPGVELR